MKKIWFSMGGNVELVDFNIIVDVVKHDNLEESALIIINNKPYLKQEGFNKQLLDKKNIKILKRKSLDPSYNLSLFSMGYATDYFINRYNKGLIKKKDVDILENVYMFVYKEIINPLSFNSISVNEHVISERVQFILLFMSYVKKYYPQKIGLIRSLEKDFKICLGFMIDDDFFIWQTNHGIMQIKSLAQISAVLKNEVLKFKIRTIIDKRLNEIIPYFIGNDGVVYESASRYWLFIYDQLRKISKIESIQTLNSIGILKKKLLLIQKFIYTITSNDYYLHGFGDSYSSYIENVIVNDSIKRERFFRFSNELAGANWTSKGKNYNILFNSLDTYPNVHKLPDDLAVYLYINAPYFVSTGIFCYNKSKERTYFQNEKSHSTVIFEESNNLKPKCSIIRIDSVDSYSMKTHGYKTYCNGQTIFRTLLMDVSKGIEICDYTQSKAVLLSSFNLDPNVEIKRLSDNKLILTNKDSISVVMEADSKIEVICGIYSDKPVHVTNIKRLRIKGNPINVNILFTSSFENQKMNLVTDPLKLSKRNKVAEEIAIKYNSVEKIGLKEIQSKIYKLILIYMVLVLLGEVKFYKKRKIHNER